MQLVNSVYDFFRSTKQIGLAILCLRAPPLSQLVCSIFFRRLADTVSLALRCCNKRRHAHGHGWISRVTGILPGLPITLDVLP